MSLDADRVIEVLTARLLRDMGDEVDLVFRYGSRLKGTTHRYSDVDISWVPASEDTWHSLTFLVDDVLCDLYPIRWSTLERMARFLDVSCTVLVESEILYQRSGEATARFQELRSQFVTRQQPDARPEMLRTARELFQAVGYAHYLLGLEVERGHVLGSLQQARRIRDAVLHCLMVVNQAPIDTRRMDQVLALPRLPDGFADTLGRLGTSRTPPELLSACDALLRATRELLIDEASTVLRRDRTLEEVFEAGYPELKADLQHVQLAAERDELTGLGLVSLYHELMAHMTEASTGISYSGFDTLSEYEQDLGALGFPDLLATVLRADLAGFEDRCRAFDRRLREYLAAGGVDLHELATVDDLERRLAATE